MRTRVKQVNIRMTEKEYQLIKKKADCVDMNITTYIIKAACDKRITIIDDFNPFHNQLNKVGNNLNQLTLLCHQGKITCPNLDEAIKELCKIYDAIMALFKKYY